MKNVEEQKKKLEQKKNRLSIEETKLKLKERKARTRHLIENGGLITKAGLDHLPSNALYGALLSLKEQINGNDQIIAAWIVKGDKAFNAEKKHLFLLFVSLIPNLLKIFVILFVRLDLGGINLGRNGMATSKIFLLLKKPLRILSTN